MKRTTRMHKATWFVLAIPVFAIATTFQNCSKVDFAATTAASTSDTGEKKIMYQDATVGQASVPPLKLIFVVDNSYTMQANQISLASAFASMFSGSNATNLAPFDSTAYIFTTSQASLAKSNSAFSLLPTLSVSDMRTMKASDLASLRGSVSAQVDGKFPGDLVSYSVSNLPDPVTMLGRLAYNVTPVLGINSSGTDPISLGAHKDKTGSVNDFASDFSNRISFISPLRSKYDSAGHGILDPVIDHESGLCALARVLKNNSGFLNKGDLAAFVIVSDEDDNDPAGANCIDAYQDYKDASLIDAHCETPQTKFTYNLANATAPTCTFTYQNGFTYTTSYNSPATNVAFSDAYHTYKNAQTSISYWTSKYTYDQYKYTVNYWSSNPTYSVPMVKVSWFTKSTTCNERDGVKYNCVDAYSQSSALTRGTYSGSNCSSFASVVPAGAVTGDAAHPVTCAQDQAVAKSGACDPNDTTITNCNQNYKQETAVTVYNDSNSASCSTLITGKLTATGAIYSFADAAHAPACGAAVLAASHGTGSGECDGTKPNCQASYTQASTPKTVAQIYDGTTTSCQSAITAAKLSSVSGAITSTSGTHAVVCSDTSYLDKSPTIGACPSTLPKGVLACTDSQQPNANGGSLAGTPGSATCQDFFKSSGGTTKYPNAVLSTVTCSAGTSVSSSADTIVTYDSTHYVGYKAVADASCPADAVSAGQALYGSNYVSCKIKSVAVQSKSLNDTCANNTTNIASVCNNVANHDCSTPADNQSSVNQPYQTTPSYKTVAGTLTCDTACTDANGACGSVTTGKVSDVLHNCQASPGSVLQSNSQTGVLASKKDMLCAAPSNVVVDKSYSTTGTETQFIAGSASKANDPNALINYIKSRSQELLGAELPATSVFVRQVDGGNGGTEGKSYKAFAAAMGGSNFDVLSSASTYASSLQSLSGVIRDKLNRSFSIQGFQPDQTVTRTWYQAAGTTEWIEKVEGTDWTASGGTVTVSQALEIHPGDSFRFEFK